MVSYAMSNILIFIGYCLDVSTSLDMTGCEVLDMTECGVLDMTGGQALSSGFGLTSSQDFIDS